MQAGDPEHGVVDSVALEAAVAEDLPGLHALECMLDAGANLFVRAVVFLLPLGQLLVWGAAVGHEQSGARVAAVGHRLTFTVWATKLDAVLRALLAEVLGEPGLARELPPGAFRDGERTEATIAEAMGEIGDMIAKVDPTALATRVIDARLERFDPLPAQPLWSVIGDQAARFHAHPEGVLHLGGVQLRTADRLLTLKPGQQDQCRVVLDQTGSFVLTELDADQELLDLLIDARLICAAPCPGR